MHCLVKEKITSCLLNMKMNIYIQISISSVHYKGYFGCITVTSEILAILKKSMLGLDIRRIIFKINCSKIIYI